MYTLEKEKRETVILAEDLISEINVMQTIKAEDLFKKEIGVPSDTTDILL